MTTAINNTPNGGCLQYDITGAASAANAGLGSIDNPEGVSLKIIKSTFIMTTKSTGAATLSVGITTAAAAATDILNALDVNADASGTIYNGNTVQVTAKTADAGVATWTAALKLTLTGSATTAGLTGKLLLEYVRV